MAERNTDADPKLDENGNPISGDVEGEGSSPKIKSKTDETDEEKEAEPEIPVRRSAEQHIIARQQRTIQKLRSKDSDDFQPQKDDEEGEEDEEDSLTPEARGAVQREVAKAIGPVVKSLASKADDDELGDLIANEPEAAKYERRIRAYMAHPHYKGVPPSVIYHHLAFDDAETTGARRKRTADLEANQSRGGGRTSRPAVTGTGNIPTADEQNEMTDEEFETLQNRARSGEFVKPGEE